MIGDLLAHGRERPRRSAPEERRMAAGQRVRDVIALQSQLAH